MSFRAQLTLDFRFDAAHRMPAYPEGHPNARLHGHSYEGQVVIEGPVDPQNGFVIELAEFQSHVFKVTEELEHRYLNDVPGLETPSGEHLCRWIWDRLQSQLPLKAVIVRRPSCGLSVAYYGPRSDGQSKT